MSIEQPQFTGFKEKVNQVILINEVGTANPYKLANAGGNSGYSFGWPQWDLKSATGSRAIVKDIIFNAKDSSGNSIFILDTNEKITNLNNITIDALLKKFDYSPSSSNSISSAEKELIEKALESNYGVEKIKDEYSAKLTSDIDIINGRIASAKSEYQNFLNQDAAKLFLLDYNNQIGMSPSGTLMKFLKGGKATFTGGSVMIEGDIGIDDLFNAYLHTKEMTNARTRQLNRFKIAVETIGNYKVTNVEEAKGLAYIANAYNLSNVNFSIINQSTNLLINQFAESVHIDGKVLVDAGVVGDGMQKNNPITGTNKNDLIFGERGNDTLIGGTGSDVLVGGEGDDKYIINNGLYDTIIDSDNKGKIEFSNSFGTINLTGGVGENGIYKSDLFAMEYKIVENDLHISSFGNLVAIYKNFDKNNNLKSRTENDGKIIDVGLGMKLEDSGTKNTTIGNGPTYVAVQTLQEWRTYQIAYQVAKKDKDGNTYYVTRYKDNPLYNVRYDGDNVINANNSSNMIKAKYGADVINAGGGHDNIYTIDGNDTINGGSGWDKIQAAGDNNVIDGGSGSDNITTGNHSKIQTGTGKDTVTAGSYANVTNESGNDRVNLGNNSSFTGSEWSENITVGINSTVLAGEGNNTINHGGGGNIDVSNGHNYIKTLDKSIISVVDGNNRLFASDENTITIGNGKNQIIIKNNNKVTIGDAVNNPLHVNMYMEQKNQTKEVA